MDQPIIFKFVTYVAFVHICGLQFYKGFNYCDRLQRLVFLGMTYIDSSISGNILDDIPEFCTGYYESQNCDFDCGMVNYIVTVEGKKCPEAETMYQCRHGDGSCGNYSFYFSFIENIVTCKHRRSTELLQ